MRDQTRVVVVTGGSSGVGRAAAIAFAARGDKVVLVARGADDLAAAASRCAGDPLAVPADITSREDLGRVVAAAVERFGRIDVWVDTAAVMAYGKFEDVPAEVFDRVVTTDLIGSANVARVALRQFRRQGSGTLILCGSLLGNVTVPYMSTYVTSKWGLRGLVRTLRQETRDNPDIHVCTLAPGSVDTPIYTSAGNYAGFVGRPPPPVDSAARVAGVVVSLADRPRASASVGATNRFIEAGFVLLPPVYDALVTTMMRSFGLSRTRIDPHPGNVFASAPRHEGGPARWSRGQVGLAAVAAAGTVAAGVRLFR
jgi:NAD(P)-dependent dehydrogenase (short-subunit alcohol dehydrogenase family)